MKSVTVLALLVLVGICAGIKWNELNSYSFEDYVQEFNKVYRDVDEFEYRKSLFMHKLKEINEHNHQNHSWKKGVNHLTDRASHELRDILGYDKQLGAIFNQNQKERIRPFSRRPIMNNLPAEVDWRNKGVITPVKDQGKCGSCWTFAAAECIESFWAIETGELQTLSEQQMASCTLNPHNCGGTGGCEGGITELAYEGVISQGGLASEWTYPYVSYQGRDVPCLFSNHTTVPIAKLSGYHVLPSNELDPLMQAVAEKGPLAVSVDASDWGSYEEGVFDGCNNVNPDINHAVQLVGYGTDKNTGELYWLVRNSWGPSWGENGYIRLKRYQTIPCGVDIHPQDGTGCDGGPSNVTVCGNCGILYSVTYPEVLKH